MHKIAVIGAGVVGLSTAVNILESVPNSSVTVIADRFNDGTTSAGAAGIFLPDFFPGISHDLSRKWMTDSWNHFWKLSQSSDGPQAGIFRISGYLFGNRREIPDFNDVVHECREMSHNELLSIDNGRYSHGVSITTVLVQCRRYLPWLMRRFTELGGQVKKHSVENIEELSGSFDIVVNCSGLGSRSLFNDDQIYPVRGQVIRVRAPWVKHFYRLQGGPAMYIHPDMDTVVLGGTAQKGDFNMTPNELDSAEIWRKCCQVLPSLKHAEVAWEWVGLRPERSTFRLEVDIVQLSKGRLKVVHNVGHGGRGVSYSWGTSKAAAALVLNSLASGTSKL